MTANADAGAGLAIIGVGLLIYFIPTIAGRKKRNANAIFALNLLLGWTVLGWVAALVWALTSEQPLPPVAQLAPPILCGSCEQVFCSRIAVLQFMWWKVCLQLRAGEIRRAAMCFA